MGLILSIDVGTTNVKAALVDERGNIVGNVQSVGTKIESDATGRAEHDPNKLAKALLEICKQVIGQRGEEIELLAMTSYMFGLVLTDKFHRPLTNISTFVDTTSQSHHARFLEAIGDVDGMYLRTGCPPVFQYPINRLHYIATHQPELRDKTAHVQDSKSFLMHLLTGECFTDYTTANSMGCLNIDGEWDDQIIRVTGFDKSLFPKVMNGFVERVPLLDDVCHQLGIRKGTCISAGLYDGGALAAGVSGFEPEIAVGNFGTSGMFRVPTYQPIEDLEFGIIQSCMVKPGLFFTGAGINNCTIATNLLEPLLGINNDYLCNHTLSTPGSHGVMTFPYFTGERDKIIGNIGTGVVLGLSLATTKDDLARSFLEGVAFSYRLIKQKLKGHTIRELRLGGGGSANLQWMQILADVLDMPVRITQNPEMGIVGAASLARHGASHQLQESARAVMKNARLIEPIAANVQTYEEVADRYFRVRSSLQEPLLARRKMSLA